MGQVLLTFAIALAGAGAFVTLGLPLPWLLGPLFGCLLAALLGARMRGTPRLSAIMRTILGVAVGASITPALFAQMGQMLVTLALMPVLVLMIGAVGYPFFRRVCGFDPATSFYSAMPGGLQDMLLFGDEAGGDVRALSLIHATRVLVIVTALPFAFSLGMGVDLTAPPGVPITTVPWPELALLAFAAIAGWQIAKFIGLFGASLLGPMFLAAALSLADLIHTRPPAEAIQAAQFFIGFTLGVKYTGITWRELRVDVAAGVGFSILIMALSLALAALVIGAGLMPMTEAILALSPGGQAEMAVVALVAGADVGVVVAHHLLRIVFIILSAPYLIGAYRRVFDRRSPR